MEDRSELQELRQQHIDNINKLLERCEDICVLNFVSTYLEKAID
jgi:hypothetical protein